MWPAIWTIGKEGVVSFIRDDALSRGAAIAFYAVTGFVPALIVTVALASALFGPDLIQSTLAQAIRFLLGREAEILIAIATRGASGSALGLRTDLIGGAVLLVTASGAFSELQSALNIIWNVQAPGLSLLPLLRARLRSIVLVAGLAILVLLSMLATSLIVIWHPHLVLRAGILAPLVPVANFLLSFILATFLFAAVYKVLPDTRLRWSDVIVGAAVTALLYQLGQIVIGLYLQNRMHFAGYGATGGIIVLLLWIYYSAQVFLLGAEFTKAYAAHHRARRPAAEKWAEARQPPGYDHPLTNRH